MHQAHLLVFVHGLWGNVHQFDYITQQLLENVEGSVLDEDNELSPENDKKEPTLVIYRASCNEGYFTYDGIDMCGSRLASNVLYEITRLTQLGYTVSKFSIVGYSLGGLIARYAIGVLYKQHVFEDIEPVLFTTFCTPHVGVVVLGGRLMARMFNFIGSYAMASTSCQLFLADTYRKDRQPLLECLADPSTIFHKALASFKRRCVYANIINDNRCEWYTAGISYTDPYKHYANRLTGHYIPGYSPIILDASEPPTFSDPDVNSVPATLPDGPRARKFYRGFGRFFNYLVAAVRFLVVPPIWFVGFILNATYQTIFSNRRIRSARKSDQGAWLYEDNSQFLDGYLEDEAHGIVETIYKAINKPNSEDEDEDEDEDSKETNYAKIALGPRQKRILDGLNSLDWNKYPVHIHQATHAHAAVIVRYKSTSPNNNFDEGKKIIDHWIRYEVGVSM